MYKIHFTFDMFKYKLGFCSWKTDDRSREKQVEPHESLVIKTAESASIKKKGDISIICLLNITVMLQGKILDDILVSR